MNFSDVRYSDPNFKFKPALGSTSQTEAGAPIEPPPADAAAPSEATPAQAAPVAEASEAAPAENGEGSTEEEKT
jgi:hypothetical protein